MSEKQSAVIIDLDGTLTIDDPSVSYENKEPNIPVVKKLNEWAEQGYKIIVHTARNMRTYSGDIDAIKKNTVPVIRDWLNHNNIPYDDIIIGKPWCGYDGIYVDDKAIRPNEFAMLSISDAKELVNGSKN